MVEWKKLGDLCTIRTGKLNANAQVENGDYPFFTCDANPYKIDKYAFDTEALLLSGNGSQVGHLNYYKGKFNAYQRTYVLDKLRGIDILYLYHYMKGTIRQYVMDKSKKGSVPYITLPMLQDFRIPTPSLSEQNRIVGILDTFTASIDNLKEQIAQRRKQYEYYRDELLDLEGKEGVEMNTLGEICSRITDGSHFSPQAVEHGYYMPSVKDMTSNGFDYSSCKQISNEDYENLVNNGCKPKINDVLIAKDGSMLKYVFPIVEEKDIVVLSSIAILTPKQGIINSQFLSYFLLQQKIKEKTIREFSSKGGVPRIILKNFKKVNVMYPSLSEQQRIVSILDTFEASIQNLEAQLSQREKQYEYYRNILLSFE